MMGPKASFTRRAVLAGTATGLVAGRRAGAQAATIRIGVLTDMGGTYRDNGGPTAVACAQQAIQDLGLAARGIQAEILVADHQNKPDLGLNIAREWFDRGNVDVVTEVNNSAVALAINGLVTERNKVHLCTGAGAVDLTGTRCSPNMLHWQSDTWNDAQIARSVVREGGDKWFFIVADYTSGQLLRQYTADVVVRSGGQVVGAAAYPFPDTTDFASFLVRAQASGATVIAFSNGGADMVNCIKQAHEFGVTGVKLVGLVAFLGNIHSLGLQAAQGMLLSESFYWDLNDRTRSFLNRVKSKVPDNWPSSEHACTYGAVYHYLKAVAEMGVPAAKASGLEAVRTMKRMPTDDDCFGPGSVRADGRVLHPMYLFQVKTPAESSGPWDLYKLLDTLPADQASRPLDQGGCALSAKFYPPS